MQIKYEQERDRARNHKPIWQRWERGKRNAQTSSPASTPSGKYSVQTSQEGPNSDHPHRPPPRSPHPRRPTPSSHRRRPTGEAP